MSRHSSTLILALALTLTACTGELAPTSPAPPPALETSSLNQISFRDSLYRYAYFVVSDPLVITFHSNHSAPQTSTDLALSRHCTHLINGGFYDTSGQPIGLFVSDSQTLSAYQANNLFNGFINLTDQAVTISPTPPKNPKNALQTGPLIITASTPRSLTLSSDKHSRRSVLALTGSGEAYFILVTADTSTTLGPLLANLPGLVSAIGADLGTTFETAINLDGGSASAFITPGVTVLESSPIGSFFCIT